MVAVVQRPYSIVEDPKKRPPIVLVPPPGAFGQAMSNTFDIMGPQPNAQGVPATPPVAPSLGGGAPDPRAATIGGGFRGGVNDFLGGDASLGLAAGILEGGTNSEAIGRGLAYALEARQGEQKALAESSAAAKEASATAAYLRSVGAGDELISLAEQGFGGDALGLWKSQQDAGPDTVIQMGSDEEELKKRLAQGEGDAYEEIIKAGPVAAGLKQDLEVMAELGKVAPQGAIQGRLASMFPGFSTAGDAFESIAKRVAPSLRTPGAGSTSDIEYDGFLKGIPALRNTPGGNQIIQDTLMRKAELNIERYNAIMAYQDGEIDQKEMRLRLRKLNETSILSPEVKQLLGVEYGSDYTNKTETGVEWEFAPE